MENNRSYFVLWTVYYIASDLLLNKLKYSVNRLRYKLFILPLQQKSRERYKYIKYKNKV